MSKSKILIFGANGWIGSKVFEILCSMNIDIYKSKCRADDIVMVQNEINELKPTHIMSFIGRTHGTYNDTIIGTIDYLEKPGKLVENINDNLYSPLHRPERKMRQNKYI
jgi:dTDP-4-dehydrorhamnose reductase